MGIPTHRAASGHFLMRSDSALSLESRVAASLSISLVASSTALLKEYCWWGSRTVFCWV